MKKLLLSLLVALAAAVSNDVMAQAYKTLSFPDDNESGNKVSAYNVTWQAVVGTDVWTIANFNNYNWNNWTYIKCGSKKSASVASIRTDFAIDKAIDNVVVTIDALKETDKINSVKLQVAADTSFNAVEQEIAAEELAVGNLIFTIPTPAANKYYRVVFDMAKASSNGIVQISKVMYNEAGAVVLEPAGIFYSRKQYDITLGDTVDFVTLNNPNNLPVTYASSNTNVATIDSDGNVEVVGVGTTTISATSEKTDKFDAGYASYIINVKAPADPSESIVNTPETAYTVAKAIELITAGKGLDDMVYVVGYIHKIKEVSTQYGNATFFISDDLQNTQNDITVYRAKYLNNEKFSAEDQIKVGDKVIMYGKLVDYNGTKEIKDCYVYSFPSSVGIQNVTTTQNAVIYNLQGIRLQKLQKGINIVNGKKVIK